MEIEDLTRTCNVLQNIGWILATFFLGVISVEQNGQVWEKVVRKLNGRMMPPPGMPRPPDATYTEVVSWLENHLDHASGLSPDPGRVVLHRLNRKEYANAVRDLFALKVDPTVQPRSDGKLRTVISTPSNVRR